MNSESDLQRLLDLIEKQLDWGPASTWQSRDFDRLNILIFEKTKVSLSASTLRRVWGKVPYDHQPSTNTLDTLAQFINYPNWRAFTRSTSHAHTDSHTPTSSHPHNRAESPTPASSGLRTRVGSIALALLTALFVAALVYLIRSSASATDGKVYSFSSRLVTRDLPNSVIFTYDATPATDSVFIQQSWDPRRRYAVRQDRHQYTSIYYLPGFYEAKLVVGKNIVQEHPLIIPTTGWLGVIAQNPVPIYLKPEAFYRDSTLQISTTTIVNKNIPLGPTAPIVEFYNVGNFNPVPLSDFAFNTEVKNTYNEGAARCQLVTITLITDNIPISIPLSAPGCISELNLLNGIGRVSGKSNDLSGFGVNLSEWVKVSCSSTADSIQYRINNKLIFQSKQPDIPIHIVGVSLSLQGAGAVRHTTLSTQDKTVFNGAYSIPVN